MISVPAPHDNQQRLQTLALENGATIEADRRFFIRRPDRRYRVRIASRAEAETLTILLGHEAGQNTCWYVAVQQIMPGCRLRGFWAGSKGLDMDLPEDVCRTVYEHTARPGTPAHEIGCLLQAKAEEIRAGGAA